jgi:sugar phosphate isomerase/epimerase
MRFRHPDGSTIHLAYCTNVHPAEDPDGVIRQLDGIAGRVREILDVPRLGVGLWLTATVAATLNHEPARLEDLRRALERNGLEVVTLNGFPYGGFHDPVVKHAVYRPDWTDPRRLDYTRDLARILGRLLPADVGSGAISTLPLGWAPWLDEDARQVATANVARLADDLAAMADETGVTVRVGLEPEPGCVLHTASEVAEQVAPLAPWVGVALDACHLAVEFEDPVAVAAALVATGAPAG